MCLLKLFTNKNAIDKDFDPKVYGYQQTGDGIHSNVYMANVRNRLVEASDGLSFSTAQEKLLGAISIHFVSPKVMMLPNANAKPADFHEEVYGYLHQGEGIHSTHYVNNVAKRLMGAAQVLPFATDADRLAGALVMRDTLQKIAMELANRTFPLNTPLPD